MSREFEIVEHKGLPGLETFFVELQYRAGHAHADMELCLLLRGSAEVSADGRTILLSPGGFALLRPCLAHEIRSRGGPALFLAVQVQPGFCRGFAGEGALEFAFASGEERMTEAERLALRREALALTRAAVARPCGWEFECAGRVSLLLAALTRSFPRAASGAGRSASHDARVRRILSYMEANCQRKLLLSELAAREGLSVSYLSHFFRKSFGATFQEYLAGLRCERARQLLAEPSLSLLDVSVASGFSDVKYLNRAFAARWNCSPREYRALAAGERRASGGGGDDQRFFSAGESLEFLDRLEQ